jgi:hypothetical protein
MTHQGVALELESYRISQRAAGVDCFICNECNTHDAELCRTCCAPMALSHQAAAENAAPIVLPAIGSAGVGKTVYLGMLLDMLSRQKDKLQLLACGAFSLTLQQIATSALSQCQFPPKTPSEPDRWNWVHCQATQSAVRAGTEIVIPDMAGEALFEEVDHPNSYPVVRCTLQKAAGTLILVDALGVQEGALDQDFFTMKLLTYLSGLKTSDGSSWRKRPIAIVFTKADECEECFDDPAKFAERRTPGLFRHCRERFDLCQFFASAVTGCTGVRFDARGTAERVPLRIEPRGIVEPFAWLVSQVPTVKPTSKTTKSRR